ncbi:hypothetical protein NK8_05000 [Caballeronia sp. NK8]|uniref:hypothetical protein n=1 Tax=Caballeronia sp. NK8 TaxID=140098 RepID=UPI001BB4E7FD|nr:hypothetical protein [Caballeronia sp. NK8]BCQ22391.1 hypothetical protein NK8_05000 [Caballeronia sp. NK8]
MKKAVKAVQGPLVAANEHYHCARSVARNGAIKHASALARVYVRNGDANDEVDALALALHDIRRMRQQSEGIQPHREVHYALREDDGLEPATSGAGLAPA